MDEEDMQPYQEFEFLELFHHNAPVCALVYNCMKLTYDYLSPNIEVLLGYSPLDFKTGGLKFAMSLVHKDHNKLYSKELMPVMFRYITLYALKGRLKDLRFSYNFKIMHKNGHYIWVMHNMSVFKINRWNVPIQFMTYITDFSEVRTNENIMFSISVKEGNTLKPVFTRTFYPDQQSFRLTKQELAILQLLIQGKTSNEIADSFSLSVHTINTHRKNMLKKTGAKNITQLAEIFHSIEKQQNSYS